MQITVNHLYSKSLNIYGDLGNVISLKYVGSKLGVNVDVVNTEIGDKLEQADIYLIGGGQDLDQLRVFHDLLEKQEEIKNEVYDEKVFILVCGGYQLFGHYFIDAYGNRIEGLGILDVETEALGPDVKKRCIGNLVCEMTDSFIQSWEVEKTFSDYLIGFENHGGQTKILSQKVKILGHVQKGYGNNFADKQEGVTYKGIIGTYMHGSLLPKNPHLTYAIIKRALKTKYKYEWEDMQKKFKEFDMEEYYEELLAHNEALKR